MSDPTENEVTNESTTADIEDKSEQSDVAENQEQESDNTEIPRKDQEWNRVKLNSAQQQRFNRMYAQVKTLEGANKQLMSDNRTLLERMVTLEEQFTKKEVNDASNKLRKAKIEAMQLGDYDKAAEIDEQIGDLKDKIRITKEEAEKAKKEAEKKAAAPEAQITDEQMERLKAWALEKDANDNLVRPYVAPNHPDHKKFLRAADYVLTDPDLEHMTDAEAFARVDQLLEVVGLRKTANGASRKPTSAVLSSQAPNPKRVSVQLTAAQKYVASKMFRDKPDPEAAYREAMLEMNKGK